MTNSKVDGKSLHPGCFSNGTGTDLSKTDPSQGFQCEFQTTAFLAKQMLGTNLDIIKKQLDMTRSPEAHHRLVASDGDSGGIFVKNEG